MIILKLRITLILIQNYYKEENELNGLLLMAGLSPLIVFSIIYMVKKKAYLISAVSLVISCAIIVTGFLVWKSPEESNSAMSAEHLNYMANVNMLSGNLDEAKSYLDKLFSAFGDTEEGLISSVRLGILTGDEQKAVLMSKALSVFLNRNKGSLPEDISAFVNAVSSGAYISADTLKANQALYNSLKTSDVSPDEYGIEKVSDADISKALESEENRSEAVISSIKKEVDDYLSNDSSAKSLSLAISASSKLLAAYDEYIASGDSESYNTIEKMTSSLNSLYKEDSSIFDLPEIKSSYVTGLITLEKYDTLIDYAVNSNDDTALAAIANLYITGIISEEDFPSDFTDNADYFDVIKKCNSIYKNIDSDDYTNAEISSIKSNLQTIAAKNSNPVLSEIEDRLSPENAPKEDMAGLYIQDSSINSALSDKSAAFEALNNALSNLNSSDNEPLKNALEEINAIVDNSSLNDNITNLDSYLSDAYKSSLPMDESIITVPDSFLNTSNSYVNEKRAMINIGIVKTDDFPTIKAYVSTSGTDITDRDNIVISDCGSVIEDYTIEKVHYSSSQIFLACDNSGSMSGDIEALKTAVSKFVESKNAKEKIGIIAFDSSVLSNTGLSKDDKLLQDAIDSFSSGGGTYIGSGVDAAFEGISSSENSFNVIIVMTDGQDSSFATDAALNELRQRCIENNVVLYTIGLGDVSADYLQNVADSGMGSFIYSSNSVQLEELYSFIHNQLDNNYLITYKAKDTTTSKDRLLTITNKADGYTGKRYYSLDYSDSDDGSEDSGNNGTVLNGINVSRLGVSTIIKGASNEAQFTILGSGFDKAKSISVSITGNKLYSNLDCAVSNDKKLTVTIPANTAYDTYEVAVAIDGNTVKLSGLSILKEGDSSSISFGDYTFSAMSVTTTDNNIYLKGNVVMNNYLHFNGDVTLTGSLAGNTLSLEDNSGSYIAYNISLPGLLSSFYDNTISMPPLKNITLYKDSDNFDKYNAYGKLYYGPLSIYDPYIELHPEYINLTISSVNFDFPTLNNLLDYVESPISATGEEASVVITKDKAGIVYSLSSDLNLSGNKSLHLGPAELSVSHVELSLDTFNHDYKAGLSVSIDGVPLFGDDDGVSFGFTIGIADGRFDALDLAADIDFNVVKVPPVTINDFHAGVEGLSGEKQDASMGSRLLGATWYGQCAVNFFKLNEIIPGLSSFLGDILDISILTLDETKLSLTLSNWNVSLDTTAVLLEVVTLGKLEADIGHYDYSNYLLGIDDSQVAGVHAAISNDLNLDFGNNLKFNVSGSSQVDINNKFAGVMSNGKIDYNIKIFKKFTGDLEGNFIMGIHNNSSQFTILIKGDDYTSGRDGGVRITFTSGDWLPSVTLY